MMHLFFGADRGGRGAPLTAAVAALAACAGSLFQSKAPPTAMYQLSARPVGAAGAPRTGPEIAADLSILHPRVRTGLDSDRIAVLYPNRRLDYLGNARWSGSLDEVMQDLTLQAFRERANLRGVHAEESGFAGGYWLEIDVADFQAEYSGDPGAPGSGAAGGAPPTVHVHLVASLGSAGDRQMLGRFEADVRRPAATNRVAAIVEAYDHAVDAALGQVVAASVDALGKRDGAR